MPKRVIAADIELDSGTLKRSTHKITVTGIPSTPDTTLFSDDFNRGNGLIGSQWEELDNADANGIVSQRIEVAKTGGPGVEYYQVRVATSVVSQTNGAQKITVTVPSFSIVGATSTQILFDLVLHARSDSDGCFGEWFKDEPSGVEYFEIFGFNGGDSGPVNVTLVAGDEVSFEDDGTGFYTMKKNGVTIVTLNDGVGPLGTVGFDILVSVTGGGDSGAVRLDDFVYALPGTEGTGAGTGTADSLSEEDIYRAYVLSWGMIDKSAPAPAGIPVVSDAVIRLSDTSLELRALLSHQTPRRRRVTLRLVTEGGVLSTSPVVYAGEITTAKFGPAYTEISVRDDTGVVFDETIPAVIHRNNYPNLDAGSETAFLNIIQGRNDSRPTNPQGVIPCPHIAFSSATGDRFAVAMHPVQDLSVYRKEPGDAQFFPVVPGEYNVNLVTETFQEYPDREFDCTYVDFIVEQPAGTEIRVDCDGLYTRPEWNGIPAAAGFDACRNPVNFLLNLMILGVLGKLDTNWNVLSVSTVLNEMESYIEDSGESTGFSRFLMDGALTKSMTIREFMGQWQASSQIDFCTNNDGEKKLNYVTDTESATNLFKEGHIFVLDSFTEELARPTVNRTKYQYDLNYATGEWAGQDFANNTADQYALGDAVLDSAGELTFDSSGGQPVRISRLEEDVFDLMFVRVGIIAATVTARRNGFLALGSYRQQWSMPLVEVYAPDSSGPLIELADLAAITHRQGLEIGGYVARVVKVTGLSLNLNTLMLTVRSILREAQEIVPPYVLEFEFAGDEVILGDLDSDVSMEVTAS